MFVRHGGSASLRLGAVAPAWTCLFLLSPPPYCCTAWYCTICSRRFLAIKLVFSPLRVNFLPTCTSPPFDTTEYFLACSCYLEACRSNSVPLPPLRRKNKTKRHDDITQALAQRAKLLRMMGQCEEAAKDYAALEVIDPKHADLETLYPLAITCAQRLAEGGAAEAQKNWEVGAVEKNDGNK